ncbi:MAG: hypothetical protein SFV19_06710 [Rhodospirillaceae bacterium]|nr:hypothetical protein [Rhodospirillaceae bacterium]
MDVFTGPSKHGDVNGGGFFFGGGHSVFGAETYTGLTPSVDVYKIAADMQDCWDDFVKKFEIIIASIWTSSAISLSFMKYYIIDNQKYWNKSDDFPIYLNGDGLHAPWPIAALHYFLTILFFLCAIVVLVTRKKD